MSVLGTKDEREVRIRLLFHHFHHPPLKRQPAPSPSDHTTSPATSTSLVYRRMLDELHLRKTSNNDASLPRTIYLPELDMEVVIPPVREPHREPPSNTVDLNSRVKLLRTSVAFGGVSFPKSCPLPKSPRSVACPQVWRFPD